MGMYIPAPTGPDDNDEEKQRMLRDYLASSSPDPKPTADMQPSQFTAGGPTTQLEQTGNAAMHADDPAPEPAAPVAPPPTAAAPVQAPADDKRDVLMQLLAQKGIDRINKPEAPEQKPVDINDSGSLNPFAAIGSVAALGLDAAMNRGRGAGQIVGATANNIDADMRAHREEQTKLAEIAAKRKDDNDPLKQYLGLANVNARDAANLTSQQRADYGAKAVNARVDPTSVEGKGLVAQDENRSTAKTKGRLEETHVYAPTITQDRVDRTRAVDQTHADVKHENAPTVAGDSANKIVTETPARAEQAAATGEALLPSKKKAAQDVNAIHDQDTIDKLVNAGGDVPIPDTTIMPGQEAAYRALAGNPAQRAKLSAHVAQVMQGDKALSDMIAARQNGGVGRIDPSTGKSEYETAFQGGIGSFTNLAHSGVLNGNEYERFKAVLPESGMHVTDATDKLQDFLSSDGTKHDSVLEKLRGIQKETRSLGESGMRSAGMIPVWGGSNAQPLAAAPAKEAPAADGGVKVYTVSRNGGKPFKRPMDAKTAAAASANGWTVE